MGNYPKGLQTLHLESRMSEAPENLIRLGMDGAPSFPLALNLLLFLFFIFIFSLLIFRGGCVVFWTVVGTIWDQTFENPLVSLGGKTNQRLIK